MYSFLVVAAGVIEQNTFNAYTRYMMTFLFSIGSYQLTVSFFGFPQLFIDLEMKVTGVKFLALNLNFVAFNENGEIQRNTLYIGTYYFVHTSI